MLMPPLFPRPFISSLDHDLFAKGYFPKEIPPPFNTKAFAELIRTKGSAAPSPTRRQTPWKSSLMMFSLARPGMLRRRLAIPHPREYYALVKCISDNFTTLDEHIRTSPYSISTPCRLTKGTRALAPQKRNNAVIDQRLSIRKRSRYLVRADISHFYPSVYTHTIPWALHTKDTAKKIEPRHCLETLSIIACPPANMGRPAGSPSAQTLSLIHI